MACGLPVVLSAGGAFEELCGTEEGYPVSAREVEVAPEDAGVLAAAGRMWQLEPRRSALGAAMRQVVADPEDRRRKGEAARRRLLERLKRAPVPTDI
jgi:glycosyltransferase involved in cell wall biosynthesis